MAVAVSGGGDSLALLSLLLDHVPVERLRALVVDHGLRADSAQVAAAAAAQAETLGVAARVLTLSLPPGAGQARARVARHDALARAAQDLGAQTLALGHTRDDQAETAVIGWARTGSWRAAAGMARTAPSPVWPSGAGLALWRPLLGVRRADLRALLADRGLAWRDDPANEDARFLRARARAALRASPAFFERAAEVATRARARAQGHGRAARAWVTARAAFRSGQEVHFSPDFACPGAALGVAAILAAAAGRVTPPPLANVRALIARLSQRGGRATLGGAMVSAGARVWRVRRDPGAVAGRSGVPGLAWTPLIPGVGVDVDGRARVWARAQGWRVGPGRHGGLAASNGSETIDFAGLNPEIAPIQWLIEAACAHALGDLAPGRALAPRFRRRGDAPGA